jgi:hypothetical protein
MRKLSIVLIFCTFTIFSFGQFKQNFRGVVVDQTSQVPLTGANVSLKDGDKSFGTTTNESGVFEFKSIPIDRYEITVSFLGYETFYQKNLDLESGKEKILTIELVEKVENIEEIVITAAGKGEVLNEMAALSARSFTIQETEKYAGSLGDPSRMASNFAGVVTANDSRNDIVIRGNSSLGLLWKLDGVSIPNPNHFGALGTTGGPVSMLNNNVLTNSDFFTGAFPAEYGNALSGVFDLKMRNGNTQKHEFVGQIGFSGFELGAEGPISKKAGSSYMINYRYSVLSVMDKLGFDVAGGAVPEYQDLTMKLYFPTKKLGAFSLFAIGGNSSIEFADTDSEGSSTYNTGNDSRTRNGSLMGVAGLSHRFFPDNQSNILTTFSISHQGSDTQIDTTYSDGRNSKMFYGEKNGTTTISASSKYTRKFNSRNTLKTGITFESFGIDYTDSIIGDVFDPPIPNSYIKMLDAHESGLNLLQGFGEWQHKFSDKFTVYGGVHFQHFFFNSTNSVDPRLSISYQLKDNSKFSLAYGLHSQLQPLYMYFVEDYDAETGEYTQTNRDLTFTNSHHFVAGYDKLLTKNLKLKIETYYQHLTDIPVTKEPSEFSMVNQGNTFHQERAENLINEGLGRNYGAEITFEKYLSNNYYFLVTTSLFDSKYRGSDNVWRNTEFNTNYVVNALGGYEIPINDKMSIDMNLRMVWSGGKRNNFIDLGKSIEAGEAVYDHSKTYSQREKDYLRLDGRISFKMNGKKVTQEWALDVTNITNQNNIYSTFYSSEKKAIDYVYQQGLFPMMLYRINF